MSRWTDHPAKKLAAVLRPGESLRASAHFEYPLAESGPGRDIGRFQEARGLDPLKDLAYRERAVNGYLGVTEARLILAKAPVLFNLKPRHVFVDAPLEECRVEWCDQRHFGGVEKRTLHFQLPGGGFTSVHLPLTGAAMLRQSDRDAVRAVADGIVAAFGERAVRVEEAE